MTDQTTPYAASEPGCCRRHLLQASGVGVAALSVAACGGESGDSGALKAADVPVGGGVIVAASKVVVTQPSAGTFKAFSAVCTHQGCTVTGVADGQIQCNCHQSMFSVADGSVLSGPATSPLPAKTVTANSDGTLTIA